MLLDTPKCWVGLILLTHSLLAQITPVTRAPTSSLLPVLSKGDSKWTLLGCYNELEATASARALGATGSYFPPNITPDNLTVPLCLGGCGAALSPNGGGPYIYAGVENSWECLCGLGLSNQSTIRDDGYCSLPCTGDLNASCGGFGYLVLYELHSKLSTSCSSWAKLSRTVMTSSLNSSQSTTQPRISKNGKNMLGMWIGIGLGLFILAVIVIIALWYKKRRYRRGQLQIGSSTAGTFIGGDKLATTLRRQPTTAKNDGRRNGIVDRGGDNISSQSTIPGEDVGNRNQNTFDVWTRGVVPPLSPNGVVGRVVVGNEKMRREALDQAGREPTNIAQDGLGSLGLNHVDERLAESETVEKGSSGVARGSFWGKDEGSSELLERPIISQLGREVRNSEAARDQEVLPFSRKSGSLRAGPDQQIMGREGAEKMAWWEKKGHNLSKSK